MKESPVCDLSIFQPEVVSLASAIASALQSFHATSSTWLVSKQSARGLSHTGILKFFFIIKVQRQLGNLKHLKIWVLQ
jgi:hypothetical protein